jgi:eukaryotic-like serine/threonine-protein kinase
MEQIRWSRIEELLQAALDLPPDARPAFLQQMCDGDETLRREVEMLLGKEGEAEHFIETPALAHFSVPTAAGLCAGQQLSHYRIEERIGAGGMGEVWRARDENLKRVVALKLLPAEFSADATALRRFEQEAFAASRLNHPNIITIFEIIHTEDAHFIATEFVEGQTLRHHLTDPVTNQARRLSVEEAVEITIQIASALKAAHTAWIIHRDIKPENVMVRADGLVKVLDFGIAKLDEKDEGGRSSEKDEGGRMKDESRTLTSSFIPHPSSFRNPPSLIPHPLTQPGAVLGTASYMSPEQALGEELDGRTDIFSLGLVLYEMVLGKRLLAKAPRAAATPTNDNADGPLAPEAKFDQVPKELEKLIRRMLRRQREERYATADELLTDLQRLKQRRAGRTARRLVKVSAVAVALALALVALAAVFSVDERWEERILRDGHAAAVRRAVFSPDGHWLVSGGEDQQVIVWDFARRERVKTLSDHRGWVTALAFSPDGKWFATAGADGAVLVWDAVQLQKVAALPGHRGVVRAIAFSADSQLLVTPAEGYKKNLWAVGSWQKLRAISTQGFQHAFFLLSPDGRGLISPVWTAFELETGRYLGGRHALHWAWAALSPDASRMVSVGSGGAVAFWEMSRFWTSLQPRLISHQRPHQDHGRAVAYAPNGELAASGAEDIILWDAREMTKLARLKYPANVMGLEFSPDNRQLVSTHTDGAILCWDVAERELTASFNEHSDSVRAVAFSPNGQHLASAGADRSVIIWNQAAGRKEMVLAGHARRVMAVAFSTDGKHVASCDMDGNVIIWDLTARRPRLKLPTPSKEQERSSYCLALSPDGRWLATSFGVYDLAEQRLLFDYPNREDGTYRQVYAVDFSTDGQRMVCVTAHGEALLWAVAEWKLLALTQLPQANLVSVRFSPDGRWLVTGEDQGAVRLWETAPLREKGVIGRHNTRVRAVAFSPNCSARNCAVASAGDDKTISLWEASSQRLIAQIGTHAAPVYAVAFAPDGTRLVSGGHDHTVRVYTRRRTLWGWSLD